MGYDTSARPFLYQGENPPHGINPLARVVRVENRAWTFERLREAGEIRKAGVVLSWTPGQASALDTRHERSKTITNPKVDLDPAASPEERRGLDADEQQMADMARHPALGQVSNRDLSDMISRLRSRRNRARDIADRQGREARAKTAPAGTTPATSNAGTLSKHDFLNAALDRATAERTARGGTDEDGPAIGHDDPAPSQRDLAQKAMALKQAGAKGPSAMAEEGGPLHPHDPDASEGKGPLADQARRTAPSGALDHAGELPSRERSRTRY